MVKMFCYFLNNHKESFLLQVLHQNCHFVSLFIETGSTVDLKVHATFGMRLTIQVVCVC